jgi:hypothetical protein
VDLYDHLVAVSNQNVEDLGLDFNLRLGVELSGASLDKLEMTMDCVCGKHLWEIKNVSEAEASVQELGLREGDIV